MQGNTKSPVQDPFIRTNKLLPTLLLLMGGMNKYDVSERKMARVLSRLYKLCILFLINVAYWKTILFPDNHKTRQKTGSELGVVTSIIGYNLNFIYAVISLVMFLSNARIQNALYAHTLMREILDSLDKVRRQMDVTIISQCGREGLMMLILEIASLFLMCSAQHFAFPFASYVNPIGMSLIEKIDLLIERNASLTYIVVLA